MQLHVITLQPYIIAVVNANNLDSYILESSAHRVILLIEQVLLYNIELSIWLKSKACGSLVPRLYLCVLLIPEECTVKPGNDARFMASSARLSIVGILLSCQLGL